MNTAHVADAAVEAELVAAHASPSGRVTASFGILLFALLVFTTLTVWAREAWALQWFQIGIYVLVIAHVMASMRNRSEDGPHGVLRSLSGAQALLVYLIPVWGVFQLVAHTTTSSFDTRGEMLRWGALSGVFYLSRAIFRNESNAHKFLVAFLCFATGMAALCMMQLNTSSGSILWMIPTGYGDIYATFQNKNNYVQFVELALPIALWGAVRQGRGSWWYALAGGVLYASAIGAASRAGFLLCSAELVAILLIGLVRIRKKAGVVTRRSAVWIFLIVPVAAVSFTFAVGWDHIKARFEEKDPYAIRRELLAGAAEMAKHRPLTGYGLGTFEQVYQRYAIKDDPFYANHAHNDWAEFAAEGGLPFLLLVLIPFVVAMPRAFRHPWALGLVATALNAWVDYPFPRPAVSGWMFALLAAVSVPQALREKAGQASELQERVPAAVHREV